jgi:hypothetical protein
MSIVWDDTSVELGEWWTQVLNCKLIKWDYGKEQEYRLPVSPDMWRIMNAVPYISQSYSFMLQLVLLLLHLKVKNSEILREKNEENKGEEGGYFTSLYT